MERAGEKLICRCLKQLIVVVKGVSEMEKRKRKGTLQPVFSVALGQCRSSYYILLGFIVSTFFLSYQPRAMLSASMVGVLAVAVHLLHGTEFGHLLGLAVQGRGEAVRYTQV